MRLFAVSIIVTTAIAATGFAQTRVEMAYADLPEAVRTGFEAHQPSASPENAVAVTEEDVTHYIVRDPAAEDHHSDTLDAEGKIVECSHDLALTDVPENVTSAARAAYPESTLVDATVKYFHGETDSSEYHFHLRSDGAVSCALFAGTGEELEDPHMAAHRD